MTHVRIEVALGQRSYDIEIAPGSLDQFGSAIASRGLTHAAVVFDQRVEAYAGQVAESLEPQGVRVDRLAVPSGEASKSLAEAARIWSWLVQVGADRKTWLIAVGGGVLGDLAGFVAASYARGIPFCQVPTTLLAQVDSSVGGKVGINLPEAKNMVGAFWQPVHVTIDPQTLHSLPDREYFSGLAEVIKYGMILDAEFFERLETLVQPLRAREPEVLTEVIGRCCRLKADVVEADEREVSGVRAVLNFGHTFAHAFETLTGYGHLLHGEAVAIGMMCAARLAADLGRIDGELVERQRRLLESFQLPVCPPQLDSEQVLACMQRDKKVEHGRLRFVLPARLGCVELVAGVDRERVRRVVQGEQGGGGRTAAEGAEGA